MKQLLLLISLGIVLFVASCEPIELNELRDFELSVEQESDTIINLSWTKSNTSNFKKYVVVRSKEPILNDNKPSDGFVLAEIQDFNTNSLTDIVTKLSADYYYKVYIELEDRFLVSNEAYIHFDDTYPLFSSVSIDAPRIQIIWSPTNVSSFKSFTVAFSDAPITNGINDLADLEHIVINEDNINTTDYVSDDVFDTYYKLFLDLGDRVITTGSQTTNINGIHTLDGFTGLIEANKQTNKLYIKGSDFYIFDYDSEQIVYQKPKPDMYNFALDYPNNEILTYGSSASNLKILIYDDNTGVFKNIVLLNNDFLNGNDIIGQNELVALSVNNPSGIRGFVVFNKHTNVTLGTYTHNATNENRYLAKFNDIDNEFVTLSDTRIDYYDLDSNGAIITHSFKTHNSNVANKNIVISPDGQYIVGYRGGLIYKKDLNTTLQISGNVDYNAYEFSEIGDKLYAASGNKVYIYSFPSLTLESIIDANISIEELFVDNGKLMLIGVLNPISPNNTYIEIIDL